MPNPVSEAQNCSPIVATTNFGATDTNGNLLGIFVSSASGSPTIAVSDATGSKIATFIPSAPTFYPMPLRFTGPLTVTIGATLACSVLWGT